MKKWNHYICEECGGVTVARHDTDGVTPFILRCRAKDEVVGTEIKSRLKVCNGAAQSQFFEVSQKDDQKPHVVFFRPETAEEAMKEIAKEPSGDQKWLIDHYLNGGSLMKEVNEERRSDKDDGGN